MTGGPQMARPETPDRYHELPCAFSDRQNLDDCRRLLESVEDRTARMERYLRQMRNILRDRLPTLP